MNFGYASVVLLSILISPTILQAQDADEQLRINAIITACEQLEHDYALYRDRLYRDGAESEAFANVFTDNGEWALTDTMRIKGREAIREYIESRSDRPPELHMQFQTTIQITPVDETTATGVSYALVMSAPISDAGLPIVHHGFHASESRSTYKLTAEGWRIAKREYSIVFKTPEDQ